MYDVSNGYRFRVVCFLLGLFLAGSALAQTATVTGYKTNDTGAICEDLESVLSKYDAAFTTSARPPNWVEFQWVRLPYQSGATNTLLYKGYRTGKLADGTVVGGNVSAHIYQRQFYKCTEPNPCFAKKGTSTEETTLLTEVSEGLFNQVMNSTRSQPFETCYKGCKAAGTFSFGTGAPEIGFSVVTNKNKYTGYMCATSEKADVPIVPPTEPASSVPSNGGSAAPPTCPDAQCPGTVNGVSVCMKCDKLWTKDESQSSTSSSSTSASGAVSSDGSSTSSTSTTTCDATTGMCTTKTTTNKTNADGSSSSSTSSDTQSKSQYCAKNPWDTKQCGGSGSGKGNGSGDGSGDGEGDGEGEGEKCEDTDLLKCMRAGDASGDSSAVGTAGATVSYTPSQSISLPTGCPAPKTFQYFGKTFSFDYDQLCIGAEKARPFVLLLAAAFASIIVVLGLRK